MPGAKLTFARMVMVFKIVKTCSREGKRGNINQHPDGCASAKGCRGATLVEVVISLAILLLSFSGIIGGYIHSCYRAEWSGYSLSAQALGEQQLEQARCATWDIRSLPVRNDLTNISTISAARLDLPISGTNAVWATNYVTVSTVAITNTINASVYLVRVDTVWPFTWKGQIRYFTNTLADYFAPD
jgi:Tfp pilus assembly protein PilV